ncbi:iron-siderophore ABC transporter substrate-binding protein [Nostoc sp. UIC 10607]|uniref:iron-siderophore ABC transporter substrate-binding protein n=1 Tax=Nostoc sp. UIC 10607 TaxID=3045935 RepID=UPI0039A185E8
MYKIRRVIGLLFGLTFLAIALFSVDAGNLSQNLTKSRNLQPPECRIVKHLMGETCVPINPQRIVVLDDLSLEIALVLGFKPVGATDWLGNFPPYLQKKIQGVGSIGDAEQPNLEKILMLKPDVILFASHAAAQETLYNQLSQIAPTVGYQWYDGVYRWQECFQSFAEALGKSSEADIVINNYQQRLEKLRRALGDRLYTTEVSLVRIYPDRIRLRGEGQHLCSRVIQDLGLPRPPAQKKGMDISLESINYADGDVIFLQQHAQANNYQHITNHPLWLKLNAVKSDKVYEVGDDYWHGGSYIAANLILDDLFKYLAE